MLDRLRVEPAALLSFSQYLTAKDENECPLCLGSGWEKALKAGRVGVRRCSASVHVWRTLEHLKIDPIFWDCTFRNFRKTSGETAEAVAKLQAITAEPDHWRGALALVGPEGSGKSHLLVALVKALHSSGWRAFGYYQFEELVARFIASGERRRKNAELVRDLREPKLLIVDGWNGPPPASGRRKLRSLFELRLSDSKMTILASRLDERALSRQFASPDSELSCRSLMILRLPDRPLQSNLFLI